MKRLLVFGITLLFFTAIFTNLSKSPSFVEEKVVFKSENVNDPPDIIWSKTYDDSGTAESVQQTSDDGYILAGITWENATLIKTDKNGDAEWIKHFGGPYGDEAYCAIECSDSGYICTGGYGYTPRHGLSQIFLMKTDKYGNEIWYKTFGKKDNLSNMWGMSVREISDGYIILATIGSYGYNAGTILMKTDSNGNELWNRTYGKQSGDTGLGFIQAKDKGFVFTGYTLSFDIGGIDAWLVKTDSEGHELWNRSYGDYSYDRGYEVLQTDDEGFIIIGGYTPIYEDWNDVCLIKTDSSGTMEWLWHYGGSDLDFGLSIARTDDHGYVIAGTTHSFGLTDFAGWIIKTDENGNKLWSKIIGGTLRKIIQSNDGKYIVAGYNIGGAWLCKIDTFENNRPAPPTYVYDKDRFQLVVSSTDQDNDRIRYGISWDNEVVDDYTNYYESGEKARINCIGHKKPVYVIAEDEHGGQSHWVKAKGSISKDTLLNLLQELLYRLGERFPILEQILQPIYDKLT